MEAATTDGGLPNAPQPQAPRTISRWPRASATSSTLRTLARRNSSSRASGSVLARHERNAAQSAVNRSSPPPARGWLTPGRYATPNGAGIGYSTSACAWRREVRRQMSSSCVPRLRALREPPGLVSLANTSTAHSRPEAPTHAAASRESMSTSAHSCASAGARPAARAALRTCSLAPSSMSRVGSREPRARHATDPIMIPAAGSCIARGKHCALCNGSDCAHSCALFSARCNLNSKLEMPAGGWTATLRQTCLRTCSRSGGVRAGSRLHNSTRRKVVSCEAQSVAIARLRKPRTMMSICRVVATPALAATGTGTAGE
mmetsp:Transcript_25666/g.81689  ORF Transcript_25666/g.81689 Transcript_25666/m.81689 type:complete len:317 (+) Transcript_25666:143-1093(+)